MPRLKIPTAAEVPHRVREHVADWPRACRQWWLDFKTDPLLLWRTPLVRISLWCLLGIAVLLLAHFGGNWVSTADPAAFTEPTQTAILYVACTSSTCGHAFRSEQALDFNDWPLTCPQCAGATAYRAELCGRCRRWFATPPGADTACPHCRQKTTPKVAEEAAAPPNPDDAEDPWD
jgi:DNA-directed RNA polymerase subunit RPC12/RpoP